MNLKTQRLVNALERRSMTAKQIAAQLRVSNPYDLVHKARRAGVEIFSSIYKDNGTVRYYMKSGKRRR